MIKQTSFIIFAGALFMDLKTKRFIIKEILKK